MTSVQIYKLSEMTADERARITRRARTDISEIKKQVAPIIDDIKNRGNQAVVEYVKKFDGVKLPISKLRVSEAEIQEAYKKIKPLVLKMIKKQIALSQKFHAEEFKRMDEKWEIQSLPGVRVGQRITPIDAVGLYIPGGTAPYPTVMQILAVPAKIAGVKRIVGVTPPRGENYEVLVAAAEAGVDELYRVGGVAAISALAYGTETIKPVDKIVGPGNIYVTASKMLVLGEVGIDMPAGPSEVLILADNTANPAYCAADILAQIEHDSNASGVLVTWSEKVAEETCKEIIRQSQTLTRSKIINESLRRYSAIIIVRNEAEAIEFTNNYAPEHLEILTKNPFKMMEKVRNAGSIFLGAYSPVAAGDYASGTNHCLPTGGWAKMFSPVGIETFVKKSEFQYLSREGLEKLAPIIDVISAVEGLDAHWNSVNVRLDKKQRLRDTINTKNFTGKGLYEKQ